MKPIALTEIMTVKKSVEKEVNKNYYAKRRMKLGRNFVTAGFIVSIVGTIVYCSVCFHDTAIEPIGITHMKELGITGLGTLMWLFGSLLHLKGAMDCDADELEL